MFTGDGTLSRHTLAHALPAAPDASGGRAGARGGAEPGTEPGAAGPAAAVEEVERWTVCRGVGWPEREGGELWEGPAGAPHAVHAEQQQLLWVAEAEAGVRGSAAPLLAGPQFRYAGEAGGGEAPLLLEQVGGGGGGGRR